MFGLTGIMSETVNADVDLQVTSMTTSKYVRDYVMKRCSVTMVVRSIVLGILGNVRLISLTSQCCTFL